MRLNLIYARARNGVIGRDGGLPWHLPEDLAYFKRRTLGCPVLMGRRTWDSLPPKFRPLPGRANLVLTRQHGWQADGATTVRDLPHALQVCHAMQPTPSELWVIGGAQVYQLALAQATRAVVTEIDADFEGDTRMPVLAPPWHETGRENHAGASGPGFAWVTYERPPATLNPGA